jgi:L-fuconolactonase
MTLIDAHQHYWQPARGDYGWLAQAPQSLRYAFLPADLRAERRAADVDFCVLVQAAPSEAETRYLFELAQQDPAVIGVVGWVDVEADDVDSRIDALVRDGGGLLRGLRPMVQDIADPDWLSRPSLDRAFDCMLDHGLCFDALVGMRHRTALRQRLRRHPRLQMVLDHAGKPAIDDRSFAPWKNWIGELSQHPALHCKLSGLLSLLDASTDESAIEPYAAELFAQFGSMRLMWGSDWPVLTTHASFTHWLKLAQAFTERYAAGSQPQVFAGNAARFYGLDIAAAEASRSPQPLL